MNGEGLMSTNEGAADRGIRVALGLALIAMVFVGPKTAWGYLGVVPILTGLVGYCPLYRVLGITTHRHQQTHQDCCAGPGHT